MNTTLRQSVTNASDMEKTEGRSFFDHPVIPFIPEDRDESLEKDEYIVLTLKVDRNAGNTQENAMMRKLQIFSHGTIEDLLVWKKEVDDVLVRKKCDMAISKFEMVETLVSGDPLNT